jgi:signal transduction histidine kinase
VNDGPDESTGDRGPGRLAELADRLAPWALGVAVVVAAVAFDPVGDPVFALVVAASGISAGLARRWLWPLFAVAVVAWLGYVLFPATFAASYYAGTTLRRRAHLVQFVVATLVVWAISVVIGLRVGGEREVLTATFPNALLAWVLPVGLPLAIGLWVDARRQLLAGLRDRAERLEREQVARAEEARAHERARIAREMHDVVAHRVSLMVLHAGVLEVRAGDEPTAEEASLIRTTGREALANLREVLGVLRSPAGSGGDSGLVPPPVLVDLDNLLDQSRTVGIRVERTEEGMPRRLPVLVEQTAYRVVQEAMTNVHKHAAGADTEVGLRYLPDSFEVRVCNRPNGAAVESLPDSGLGLVGLRERVEVVGGRLDAEPTSDGGFVVRARLAAPAVEEPL